MTVKYRSMPICTWRAPDLNRLEEKSAKGIGVLGVAGSKTHDIEDLWSAYTQIEASLNANEILSAIRKGFVKASSFRKSIRF